MSSVANGGWVPQDDVPSVMSFWDCKINYNRCLGSGEWGTVYEVVPRPNNEQNYWSYLFPYVYDYIFRPSEPQHAVHCVKVLAPLPTAMIIVSAANKFLFIGLLAGVLFGRYKEKWSNLTARKYGLSTVKFSTTYSLLSQFKTKVNGHTFHYHAQKLNFNKQNKFHLRRAFVIFLQKLNNDKLSISDLHEKNIMYDKAKDCWEIVDGDVNDGGISKVIQRTFERVCALFPSNSKKNNNIDRFFHTLNGYYPLEIAPILKALAQHAKMDFHMSSYSETIDIQLMQQSGIL